MRHLASLLVFFLACLPVGAAERDSAGTTSAETCRVTPHVLVLNEDRLCHPVTAEVRHSGPPTEMSIVVAGCDAVIRAIDADTTQVEFVLPACDSETLVPVAFSVSGETVAEQTIPLSPARKLEIYLLPHSHVDIGYTKIQTEVEQDHWRFLEQAIDAAQQMADFPEEAQFKWNAEVLWAVDGYLEQASPDRRTAFIEAVKRGQIGIDAFYCHELAGLCRPEELVQLLALARRMRREHGIAVESAMVTDCAGLTWGAVPVLAQSGVKYLSLGPNSGHRTGYTREAWDNRPFYWVSPCGRYSVLCWQTSNSYHPAFHNEPELRTFLESFDEGAVNYPYDILYFRQCRGDNRGPGLELSAFVNDWNERFAYPKLIIARTPELFRAFEERYGDQIPSARGDFSPYWEDGAASSARETALNRGAAERLVQAETLRAMLGSRTHPVDEFDEAWRNVLLYNEHTWGARSYVNSRGTYPPGSKGYDAQWRIKQAFALQADAGSRELLGEALDGRRASNGRVAAVDVLNTSSWPRTDLVLLSKDLRLRGDVVRDTAGNEIPSQRLESGELAVLVKNVPAFGAARLTFHKGRPRTSGNAQADGATLRNGLVRIVVDEDTGAIRQLIWEAMNIDLADPEGAGLNSYHYVPGFEPKRAKSNGPVTVTVKERGPLVASIVVESDAPGCNRLVREMQLVDGLNRVDIASRMDKKAIPLSELLRSRPRKEGYHFGFAFHVPDGVMRVDMPWSVVRPEADQLPGACRNWLSVQRWVDISNQEIGVTWATVDAPLIEVGTMSRQPRDPFAKTVWRKFIEPSETFYSYVMNNYWTTNYRHDQEGPITFRYSIQPHGRFDVAAAARFGTERSQPLVVVPVDEGEPVLTPFLSLEPAGVIATALKPATDGAAWVVRLFGASGQPEKARLAWGGGAPAKLWRSDLDGLAFERVTGSVDVLPFEMVTLRIERDE